MTGELARRAGEGRRLILIGVAINLILAVAKFLGGAFGNSKALMADGVESALDILSSGMMWAALKVAARPADATHPYGHGKVESLAAISGALLLLGVGASVAYHSLSAIVGQIGGSTSPIQTPEPFTLVILLAAVGSKELLFRIFAKRAAKIGSSALLADAWHHRSDALTSLAALAGITIALVGGPAFAQADAWAALFSCGVILLNGGRMLRASLGEILDEQLPEGVITAVVEAARRTEGVSSVEKCRVRKSGLTRIADLHVRVSGERSVRDGHAIAHAVKDAISSSGLNVSDVTVHIEPEPGACPERD